MKTQSVNLGYRFLLRGLIAAFPALGATLLSACDDVSWPERAEAPSSIYETVAVEIGDVRDIVPAVGPLRAATEVEVGAEVGGRILELHADFNDEVEEGALLARIDPAPFQSRRNQSRAQLVVAEAAVDRAEADLAAALEEEGRLTRLIQSGAARAADLTDLRFRVESLRADVAAAQGGADLARGRLQQAEIDLARTEIRSPVTGFVLDRRVEVGQTVNVAQRAPTLFVVTTDLSQVYIDAAVSEADIGRVEAGMDVRFSVDAFPGNPFSGEIESIRRAPVRQGRFVSYTVVVVAENPFGQLLPGMTASVEFVRADARSVRRIPINALYFTPTDYMPVVSEDELNTMRRRGVDIPDDPDIRRAMLTGFEMGNLFRQGKRKLFVEAPDGSWERRVVRLGGEDREYVEVIEGLEVGERVILGLAQP